MSINSRTLFLSKRNEKCGRSGSGRYRVSAEVCRVYNALVCVGDRKHERWSTNLIAEGYTDDFIILGENTSVKERERERETVGIPRTLVGNRKPRMRFELLKSDGNEVRRTRREITASLDSLLSIFRPDATAGERANSFRRLNEAGSVISRVARNIRRGSNFHARNARTIAPMSRSRALSTLEFAVRAMPYLSASILPEFTGTFANLYIRSVQGTRKLYSRWNPLIVALNVTLSEWRDIESSRFSRNCTRVITSRRSLSNRSSKILSHFFVRYCVSSLFLFLISFSCIPK